MADPSITSRPNKTIDGYDSKWVACGGALPVQYKIENDKFPVNSFDSVESVLSVANVGGKATLQTGVDLGYSNGDKLTLTNFTDYSGTATIVSGEGSASLVLDIDFVSSSTGNVQLLYNNYAIEVKIYAGINTDHSLTAQNPISLISTIKQIPDSDNICRVDVSQYVKTQLSPEKNLVGANDLNAWTDFYIEFREIYTGSSTSFIDDSANIFHGVFGVLQFQNENGGNMANYVSRPFVGQFMTDFEIPTIYPNISTISILIDSPTDLDIIQLDVNGSELETNTLSIVDNDRGLYRIPLNFTLNQNTKKLSLFL